MPPGSIVYTGQPKEGKTGITLFSFDDKIAEVKESDSLQELIAHKKSEAVNWFNFDSLHDSNLVIEAGQQFNIHNLTLEDIVHVGHPPKLEEYDNYLFLTMKMLKPGTGDDEGIYNIEHISFIVGKDIILSFQEYKGDPFDGVRERILSGKSKARGRGPDYLLFLLVDAIVDQYLLTIEWVERSISELELEVFENPREEVVGKIIEHKKVLSALRKVIYPVRDALKDITNDDSAFINDEYYNYFNDVFDHIKNMVDHLDNQREMLTSLMEFYMSQISNQMNKVMQTLTIIATIFIPLTFVAGIYGMNFQNMPELNWKWGYPVILIAMLILGIGMYIYMRRKRWF